MKIYWAVLCLFIVCIYWLTDGFLPQKLVMNNVFRNDWILSDLKTDLLPPILSQKFYYLNKGHQCFVFVSEDGQYVIKLINQYRFRYPKCLEWIPSTSLQGWITKRKRNLEASFQSFKIAIEKLPMQAGLIYVQLNSNPGLRYKIVMEDSFFKEYTLDLGKVPFILQRRATPIYAALQNLREHYGKQAFHQGLISFVNIVKDRIQKKISDDDLDVEINYGFLDRQAIMLDIGRLEEDLSLKDPQKMQKELIKSTKLFRQWLQKNFPDEDRFFEQLLHI